MNFFKKEIKTPMGISILMLFFIPSLIYAINSISTGYRLEPVNPNVPVVSLIIDAHGVCKGVILNASSSDHFISTKSSLEWLEFRNNHPAEIALTDCCTPTDPLGQSCTIVESVCAGDFTNNFGPENGLATCTSDDIWEWCSLGYNESESDCCEFNDPHPDCAGSGGYTYPPEVYPSDIRLKTRVVLIGIENGINIYEFTYISEPGTTYRGVIAQEVMEIIPEAVVMGEDGYYRVRYDLLGIEFKKIK